MTINQQFAKHGINPNSQTVSGTNFVIGQRPSYTDVIPGQEGGAQRREFEGAAFTSADLQAYVMGLEDAEKEALQEALWVEGFYGVVDTMDAIDGTGLSLSLGDLVDITADADTASCDLELFVASI